MTSDRVLKTRRGADFPLPMFLPVYKRDAAFVPLAEHQQAFGIEGCICNAFFLYKDREIRAAFDAGRTLREHVGLEGLLMTDSGAFQGFTRPLFLNNKEIVRFQDRIGADVSSPLDLVSPPGDVRSIAEKKMVATLSRIREAKTVVERSVLAGVQQGGKFLDLRRRSVEGLMEIGVDYVAIGSLVPFFNRNHELTFVNSVIRDARAVIGAEIPMHVYGAGDPVELPFFAAMGADIFDSSSYGHYAQKGFYMTPYGAIDSPERLSEGAFDCDCPSCSQPAGPAGVFNSPVALASHNLWTICRTVLRIRSAIREGSLEAMLKDVLERHQLWFPDSRLGPSWAALHE